MNICIIPARGGSKRIPRKNIKPFFGKPMIAWSIEKALASDCFDRIIVSTDDLHIAETAIEFGAEVPFLRPPHLSDDYTPTQSVIQHAINSLSLADLDTFVCCLYPTVPFLVPSDINTSFGLIADNIDARFIFPATTFPYPVQRSLLIDTNGFCRMSDPRNFLTRSQDLAEHYHDSGQFYLSRASTWLEADNIFHRSFPLIIPRWRVHDLDTLEDWRRAELFFPVFQSQFL